MPTYPNVPNVPGVPPLPRDPNAPQQTTTAPDGTAVLTVTASPLTNQWAIFDADGTVAIEPDSFASIDYAKEYNFPTYPIEEGSFETYNMVELPFDGAIRITKEGTAGERKTFLQAVENILASTDLYTLVTPERSYRNVKFRRESYGRSGEQGTTLLVIELQYAQIRQGATQTFSNTAQPSGASPTDGGNVVTQTPTPAQVNAFGPMAGVG